MKLVHLSDLHLGKRLNEFSLIDDQRHILEECLRVIDAERPDAVILAGDLYDKSVPSAEAVVLFDSFLVSLAQRGLQIFAVSGNHDSAERISFASRILDANGVHFSRVFDGSAEPVVLQDEHGEVRFYLLPFLKPALVRPFYPDAEITDYTSAYRTVIESMKIDRSVRNVLVAHAFVTGAERSESEEVSVGGADNVDASAFAGFDYVALGHIHGPQNIGERIRYCGTPLKYSFSEAKQQKSVTVAELGEKGDLRVHTVPLIPKRDLCELRGSYMELVSKAFYEKLDRSDYMHITLTDEEDVPDAVSKLRVVYPNLMKLDYDNTRTRSRGLPGAAGEPERKTPLQLFGELYEKQNGAALSEEQAVFCADLMECIREAEA